jgi:cytoskeleton protein RodZ
VDSKTSEQTHEGGARGGSADGSLGQQLRRAREARGVTLREISEQTRITMRHLEAIEADDYKDLPGGIFNKSFIKSFARSVGFDERRALELYARQRGESDDDVPTTPHRSRIYMGDPARSPFVTFALSAVIVLILVLIIYAGLHYYRRTEVAQTPAASPTPASAATPAANTTAQAQQQQTAAQGLQIQVSAKDKGFWLTTLQDDDKKKKGRMIFPDKPEEFTPQDSLNLMFDKPSVEFMQVSINGRPARLPDDAASAGQWKITKDNYRQFIQ